MTGLATHYAGKHTWALCGTPAPPHRRTPNEKDVDCLRCRRALRSRKKKLQAYLRSSDRSDEA